MNHEFINMQGFQVNIMKNLKRKQEDKLKLYEKIVKRILEL